MHINHDPLCNIARTASLVALAAVKKAGQIPVFPVWVQDPSDLQDQPRNHDRVKRLTLQRM